MTRNRLTSITLPVLVMPGLTAPTTARAESTTPGLARVVALASAEITIRRIPSAWPQRLAHFLVRAVTLDKCPRVVFRVARACG